MRLKDFYWRGKSKLIWKPALRDSNRTTLHDNGFLDGFWIIFFLSIIDIFTHKKNRIHICLIFATPGTVIDPFFWFCPFMIVFPLITNILFQHEVRISQSSCNLLSDKVWLAWNVLGDSIKHLWSIVDVDECETGNGGCSQKCVNRNATYECRCEKGYQLQADNRTCLGNDMKYFQGQFTLI